MGVLLLHASQKRGAKTFPTSFIKNSGIIEVYRLNASLPKREKNK